MHWPCIFDFSVFPWLQKFQFYVNFNNFCTINVEFFLEILCSMRLWVRTTVLKLWVRVCECMCSDGRCWHCVCSDGRGGVNVAALTSSLYEAQLDNLLTSAKLLDTANVPDCLTGTGLGFYIPDVSGSVTSADLSLSRWVCLSHTHCSTASAAIVFEWSQVVSSSANSSTKKRSVKWPYPVACDSVQKGWHVLQGKNYKIKNKQEI